LNQIIPFWSNLIKFEQVWASLNQSSPFDPVWTYLFNFEPNQAIMILFDPICSSLIKFDQVWTNLFHFYPIWSSLNKFEQVWTNLNQFNPFWSNFIRFDQVWTGLIKFEQHVSNFQVKSQIKKKKKILNFFQKFKKKFAQKCSKFSKSVDDDDDHEKLFLRPRAKRSSRSKTIIALKVSHDFNLRYFFFWEDENNGFLKLWLENFWDPH
jgi:hypothetical protein